MPRFKGFVALETQEFVQPQAIMPLLQEGHDHLSHIDPTTAESDLDAARAVLAAELQEATTNGSLHPAIPAQDYEPSFSSLLNAAHESIGTSGKPRTEGEGIDLSRYEEPEPPTSSSSPDDLRQWRAAIKIAYTSQSYLSQRSLNLSLLERYGKNAWLISNSQLEDELRAVELELKKLKNEGYATEDARRLQQTSVQGELETLQTSWQASLGRAIEAEVAGAALQQDILAARRAGATST